MTNLSLESKTDLEEDFIRLDDDTAALVIRLNGDTQMYLPGLGEENENVPSHSLAISALAMYWSEHHEEIMDWFQGRMRH